MIGGGATLIQLREKHMSPIEFFEDAKEAIAIARHHGVKIIINDRVDIAIALEADGVHLGQDDLPPSKAREILGGGSIIGYSTHNVEQAIEAAAEPVDYIAIGPIFATTTKEDPDRVVGLAGLRQARQATGAIPLIAIGGVSEADLYAVFEAGADSIAMISEIVSEPVNIELRLRRMLKRYQMS
jgi:thiamine-phosphate pyrophosphorylase